MKKAKIAFWLILIAFMALLAYQNWDFFMSEHHLRLDLFVIDEFSAPELPNAILFLIFFFAGFLISYFITLPKRFKLKKMVKKGFTYLKMSKKSY